MGRYDPVMHGTRQLRQTIAEATNNNIRQTMVSIASNPIRLAEVVAGGPYHWRLNFLRGMHGLAVDENVADSIFKFFCEKLIALHPDADALRAADVDPAKVAGAYLDQVEVATPPTQEEIEKAWELDIASSDEAMKLFYEGSARHRTGPDFGEKPTIH